MKIQKQLKEQIVEICRSFNNDPCNLINVLHQVQGKIGYLPVEVQQVIADCLQIPASKVFGVVTFYAFFTMVPKGKYAVSVCMGTACYVRGAEKVLEEFERQLGIKNGETDADGLFSLNTLRCVGACGLAPVVMVGDKVYGRLTADQVKGIVAEYRNME